MSRSRNGFPRLDQTAITRGVYLVGQRVGQRLKTSSQRPKVRPCGSIPGYSCGCLGNHWQRRWQPIANYSRVEIATLAKAITGYCYEGVVLGCGGVVDVDRSGLLPQRKCAQTQVRAVSGFIAWYGPLIEFFLKGLLYVDGFLSVAWNCVLGVLEITVLLQKCTGLVPGRVEPW